MSLLDKLNEQQKIAVSTTQGALLILAGAGSGKTRVLTHRIAFILENGLAYPEEILAVTFTNKAAKEMKERVTFLTKNTAKVSWIGTFHAVCVRILRRDIENIGITSQFTIYDESDQLALIKDCMKELQISEKNVNPKSVIGAISSAKNELIEPEDYINFAHGYFQENVATIYMVYQKRLTENHALDFDDIIMKTIQLFKRNDVVLEKYQNLFKYIHVDEYQDTNHAQYVLINLLAQKNKNICVVGDDDQSIYSWRGATIRNILNFESDYPNVKVVKLEQNYRSTKKILEASYEIIKKNRNRKDKKLWTENIEGEKIKIYQALDEKDEGYYICDKIEKLKNAGISLSDIAILYRVNAQSRSVEEILLKTGIQYKIVGGVRFYDRKEIKDILSYLKTAFNPSDNISAKRIINEPARGVGPKTIEHVQIEAAAQNRSIIEYLQQNRSILKKGLADFTDIITLIQNSLKTMNIFDLLNLIIDKSGYMKSMMEEQEKNLGRIENIKELITLASDFTDLGNIESTTQFLEAISLYETLEDRQKDTSDEAVTLMTIHSAKGLEFEHVFLAGMEEGLFPHSRSYTDPQEMEEERRLAYVAVTRAKKVLHITYAHSRNIFGTSQQNLISRFVEEIPESIVENSAYTDIYSRSGYKEVKDNYEDTYHSMDLSDGMRVKHKIFGIGTVVDYDDSTVKIDFGPRIGTKELLLEFAKLEIV